jgi:uncharacterized phiE125 gp8 family phage protein
VNAFALLRNARTVVQTAPTHEPVTLSEAKAQLRRSDAVEDSLITGLIQAAREKVEKDTGRALVTQTHDVYFDGVPCGDAFLLPNGRLQSVTSVKYYDEDNAEATFATSKYLVDTASEPGRIVLNADYNWPDADVTLRAANAVIVRGVFGYGSAAAVPQSLKQAMLLLIGTLNEHREQVIVSQFAGQFLVIPFGYDQLIGDYKMWLV